MSCATSTTVVDPYFHEISLDHAALAQLPENGELPGLPAVTLPDDESGTDPDFEQSEEHDSEQLSSSFVPTAVCTCLDTPVGAQVRSMPMCRLFHVCPCMETSVCAPPKSVYMSIMVCKVCHCLKTSVYAD